MVKIKWYLPLIWKQYVSDSFNKMVCAGGALLLLSMLNILVITS